MIIVNDEFQPFLNDLANIRNIESPKGDLILLMSAYTGGDGAQRLSFPIPLAPNQWHHIAYQSNGPQTTMIVNDFGRTMQQDLPLGHDPSRPLDFVLGGFGKIIEVPVGPNKLWFWDSFTGYIDEIRISTEPRYDVEKKGFMPDGKFKNDAKTAALWHFDEPSGTREFSDASGNAYHLEGKMARGPAPHLQSKHQKNSPQHGDGLNNETAFGFFHDASFLPQNPSFIIHDVNLIT